MAIVVLPDALTRFLGNEAADDFCRLLNIIPFAQMNPAQYPLKIEPNSALHKVFGEEGSEALLAYINERYEITPPSPPANS